MEHTKKYFFSAILVSIVFVFGIFQNANAIEYGMLGGKPAYPDSKIANNDSWFIYNLKPGEAKEDGILVMNLFEESLDVLVYAADTIRSSSGGFALKQFSEPKEQVGSWIKFYPDSPPQFFQNIFEKKENKIIELCKMSREDLQKEFGKKINAENYFADLEKWCQGTDSVEKTFKSNEKTIIPFVFTVPQNSDVGEHTGGILIQKKAVDDMKSEGSSVKLTTRVGVRVYETVPGEIIKKIALEKFQVIKNFQEFSFSDWFGETKKPKEFLVQTEIKNEGNMSLEHENNIYIDDLIFGKKTEKVERKFQVLKDDKFIANLIWRKPVFGYYSFRPEIKYQGNGGEENITLAPIKIWVIPWREISILIILLFLIYAGYRCWKYRQKKKYGGIGWEEYKIKKTDTVAKLAERHKIGWKVLVKTNKLKAPYLLEAGQIILVPGKGGFAKKEKAGGEKNGEIANIKIGEKKKPLDIMDIYAKKESRKSKKGAKESAATNRPGLFLGIKNFTLKNKKIIIISAVSIIVIISVSALAVLFSDKEEAKIEQKLSIPSVGGQQKNKNSEAPKVSTKADEKENIVKNSDIAVKVFNGGAVSGSAAKIKELLVKKGYSKTEAENAENDNHIGQAVYYQKDFKETAESISKILIVDYPDIIVKEAIKAEEKSADVVVMLGK